MTLGSKDKKKKRSEIKVLEGQRFSAHLCNDMDSYHTLCMIYNLKSNFVQKGLDIICLTDIVTMFPTLLHC